MYQDLNFWRRIRRRILENGESISHVSTTTQISRTTIRKMLKHESPQPYIRGGKEHRTEPTPEVVTERPSRPECVKQEWMQWLYRLERSPSEICGMLPTPPDLLEQIAPSPHSPRKRALAILASRSGFSIRAISEHLGINRHTVRGYLTDFEAAKGEKLRQPAQRKLKSDDPNLKSAVFSLLHEPPTLSGYNRTTWRMQDLQKTLKSKGLSACTDVIRTIIRESGFRWKSARVVLTSTDPEYREKLQHVQDILSHLGDDERFFSIDEFGPFAIKTKAGRVLVETGVQPTVPQWQKSKGWLIATAALELSTNQVTHFYSKAKNTTEMIRMAKTLIEEYKGTNKLYLSWDAASWHMSKELLAFVEEHNRYGTVPAIELAPLPASAQFLNVIESVFSGMARAIIHNSDYPSVTAAQTAIDRYFDERNQYYKENPKRAGKKIWGLERNSAEFSASNNCKDPDYR